MQKMKIKEMRAAIIAIVVPVIRLAGGEKIAAELAYEINGENYQVHLVIINEKKNNILQDKLDSENIKCHFYGHKENNVLIRKIHQLKWIFNTLDKLNPDIIHVHLDYYFTWIYSLLRGKRILQTFHSQPFRIRNFWTKNVYKVLHKKGLITSVLLTENLAAEFSKLFCVEQESLVIVPNFVESKNYFYPERDYTSDEEIVFTFIARFHPVKNHHMLITAFSELLRRISNSRLLLAGDGEMLNAERDYVQSLGIEGKVDFLGEITEISNLLKRTDISVISSISEAFPLVLLEAMAAGLPVIVTNVGGMQDIVDGNGIKVSADDYFSMADAMEKLALDSELRKQYGKRSLELVKKYEMNTVVEKYKKVYISELEKNR